MIRIKANALVLLGDDASANEFYDQAMSLELGKSLCA
jgi:hypothetical protein